MSFCASSKERCTAQQKPLQRPLKRQRRTEKGQPRRPFHEDLQLETGELEAGFNDVFRKLREHLVNGIVLL